MGKHPLKIGIVGFGGFGQFLYRAWSGVDGAVVTHVADPADISVPNGLVKLDSSLELVSESLVDAVSIATPPLSHVRLAEEALSNGCHTLIEKPIATTPEDAHRILKARDGSGCTASVNFMLRFNPIISCVHHWCRAGVFGHLQRVVVENYAQDESLGSDHWFWDQQKSGGILVEHGVHFFDIVNGATDAPVASVTRRAWSRNETQEDRVFALVEYEDGLVASHYHAFNRLDAFERTTIRFVFDAAQVDIAGWIPMEGRLLALANGSELEAISALPNLEILSLEPLQATRSVPLTGAEEGQRKVDSLLTANFRITGSKEDAYLAALRELMRDFLNACLNKSHSPAIRLEDGLTAVQIALGSPVDRTPN